MNPTSNKSDFEDLTTSLKDLAYSYLEKYSPSKQQLKVYLLKKYLTKIKGSKSKKEVSTIIDEIIEPGDARIPPVCQHFRYCGGCALQHLSPNAVAAFKRSALQAALAYKNLNNISIQDTISIPPGTRRRVEFAIDKQKHAVSLGFNAAMSRKVIDIAECAVALPSIVELLTPLRELISTNEAAVKANPILAWKIILPFISLMILNQLGKN